MPRDAGTLPSLKLHQNVEWVERQTLLRALESAGGVKKEAAELMGISQRALSYYLGSTGRRRNRLGRSGFGPEAPAFPVARASRLLTPSVTPYGRGEVIPSAPLARHRRSGSIWG
jgi:hypothetical protein